MKTINLESVLVFITLMLFTYSINAQTWEEIGFNLPARDTASSNTEITFTNKNIGWLFTQFVHRLGSDEQRYGNLYRTTDGGQNWETIINGNYVLPYWTVLFSMEPDFFYMIRGKNALFTTDGGNTWDSTVIENATYGCSALYFFNEQKGITFDNHSWITTDGGKNWEIKGEISAPINVYFYNNTLGWAVSIYNPFGTDAGYIANTTDGGNTWEYQDKMFGSGVDYYGIEFLDSLRGFAVGGSVGKTIDGGKNWQNISGVAGSDVGFLDNKNGWITGGSQIFRTTDGGKHGNCNLKVLSVTSLKKL